VDVPEVIKLELRENNNEIASKSFTLTIREFLGGITELKPIGRHKYFNILLFGIAGATKSSFINSIYTLIHNDRHISTIAPAGGTAKHTTGNLVRYKLYQDEGGMPGLMVHLWDTWGLTPQTYTGNELPAILRGELPHGWDMGEPIPGNVKLQKFQENSRERQIDAILFFIPHAAISDTNQDPLRKHISKYFTDLVKSGYNPMLLITRVDEVCQAVRDQPNGNYPELETLRLKAAQLLNIGPRNVFYNINYTKEKEKVVGIDKMSWVILDEVMKRGRDYQTGSKSSTEVKSVQPQGTIALED